VGQIIFHCTHCGAKLAAELDEAGEEFECPTCQRSQKVPGGQEKGASVETTPGQFTGTPSGPGTAPVVRIPKRKIILSTHEEEEDEEEVEVFEEEMGGTGLALFAIALGTAGLLLCSISMIWMLLSRQEDGGSSGMNWWVSLIVFLATFLMGLMGLVLAQLARLVVRLADRVSQLTEEE